jgi:hypothetical protein
MSLLAVLNKSFELDRTPAEINRRHIDNLARLGPSLALEALKLERVNATSGTVLYGGTGLILSLIAIAPAVPMPVRMIAGPLAAFLLCNAKDIHVTQRHINTVLSHPTP